MPPLLSFLLMIAAGCVHRHQLIVIEFLQAENRRFWCIKGTQREETHQFNVDIDHGVSAWSQIVRSEAPTRGRPRPNENWCLWILCASSIPAIVTAALANDLKPRMGPHLCLIAR